MKPQSDCCLEVGTWKSQTSVGSLCDHGRGCSKQPGVRNAGYGNPLICGQAMLICLIALNAWGCCEYTQWCEKIRERSSDKMPLSLDVTMEVCADLITFRVFPVSHNSILFCQVHSQSSSTVDHKIMAAGSAGNVHREEGDR